jgi:KUP system potassium uptake protein
LFKRRGTGFIGGICGPIMLAWFIVIGILGLRGIVLAPGILAALENPFYRLAPDWFHYGLVAHKWSDCFLFKRRGTGFIGGICGPIMLAWFIVIGILGLRGIVLAPGILAALENPFYRLAPDWFHYGLVAFATLATVIASQAIISGAFSLTQQAIQLGFLPRISVLHTASHQRGQIYVPLVNWTLAIATLGAVVAFGSSDNLAGAYAIAVSLLMAITTALAAAVAIQVGFNPVLVIAVNGFFLLIDLIFFAANSMKLFQGGWFPLLIAAAIAFLMLTWRGGQQISEKARSSLRESEKEFVANLLVRPPVRVPGTAAFLTSSTVGIPLTLTHHLKHSYALHERVLSGSNFTKAGLSHAVDF